MQRPKALRFCFEALNTYQALPMHKASPVKTGTAGPQLQQWSPSVRDPGRRESEREVAVGL